MDTAWGPITLRPFLWRFIDTDVFQRLRYLQQTGLLQQVMPGATHTRFSHSIGVSYLADTLLTNICRAQPELRLTEGELNTVALAALCHDLGHGPASHGFDKFMWVVDPEWRHEHQSVRLLQHMVDARGLQDVVTAAGVDVHMACEVILGCRDAAPPGWRWRGPPPGREFLYEIVSNSVSGMDVDKWDYLKRDAKYLHLKGAFSCQRLLGQGRVVAVDRAMRLAWPVCEAANVMNMFLARYNLHGQAFQHRVTRCIECMCMHGLLAMRKLPIGTTGVLLEDAYKHLDVFVKTTDWVITAALQGLLGPDMPGAEVFARVVVRDLWKTVGSVMLPTAFSGRHEEVHAELAAIADTGSEAFVVDVSAINCGKGRYDPMSKVPFYEVREADDKGTCVRQLQPKQPADYMRPMYFQRRILRVFAKDTTVVSALREALKTWTIGALGSQTCVSFR